LNAFALRPATGDDESGTSVRVASNGNPLPISRAEKN
jgi:hypothetical protein